MNILALDTCLTAVSVAVSRRAAGGELLLCEASEKRSGGHAERLMPMIDTIMREAGLEFSEIDRIGVTLGPGTFTGVRVGVAAARGFALATGRPVVGMTTLALLAHQANGALGKVRVGRILAVALDARRGMVYAQLFGAAGEEVSEPLLLRPEEFAVLIGTRPVVVVGSAGSGVANAISAAGGLAEAILPDLAPSARALALLAPDLAPVSPVRPFYLRSPDAKPQVDQALPRAAP
jgi:tRNA threonylcarbamoyladenosine biosynthesis protein TsaB